MIIDGHAHVYAEKKAAKIVFSFTELHHMGTDLFRRKRDRSLSPLKQI